MSRDALDALSTDLAEVEELESFAHAALGVLASVLPGISLSYNEVNVLAQRAFAVIVPEPDAGWWERYQPVFEAHVHQHPVLAHIEATGDTRSLRWTDVAGGDDFRRTELFRQFYEPLGIESQLVLQLPAPNGVVVAFAVNRSSEGFSDDERELLDQLRPHLIQGYRRVQLRAERSAFATALAGDGWEVVLVDSGGRVLSSSSPAASAQFEEGSSLPEPLLERFSEAVRRPRPVSAPAVPVAPIVLRSPGVPLSAVVIPSPVPPHVVLLREHRGPSDELLTDWGLTPRQREVAMLVAAGSGNDEIARSLGCSVATVKKHLEGIYSCLGVSSRAAAVAVMVTSV